MKYNPKKYWEIKGKEPVSRDIRQCKRLDKVVSFLKVIYQNKPFKTILEIGCGDGRVCKPILDFFDVKYTGIDISPDRIRMAKENLKDYNLTLIEGDFLTKEFKDIDLVLCVDILQHTDRIKIIDTIKKIKSLNPIHFVMLEPMHDIDKLIGNPEPHSFLHNYEILLKENNFKFYTRPIDALKAIYYGS